LSNNGSIFSDDNESPRPKKGKATATSQVQPASILRRKWRITYPIFRDILLALIFLVALPMEMFAPEMYKPSTWIGNRLGLLAGQQQTAQAGDQIGVINRVETETADAKAGAQSTITRGTADAQADSAAISAAEQADIRLVETARMEATLADIKLQVQLSGQCEAAKLQDYHNMETQCVGEQSGSYGVCANALDVIQNRVCPALPDPKAYPNNLREYVQDRVDSAMRQREKNQKRFQEGD